MREIIFRGKLVRNGEWIYGDLINTNEFFTGKRRVEIWTPLPEGEFDPNKIENEVVDPATVGQFTGLYDKNGQRIFEGDIVAVRRGLSPHEVKFDDGGFFMSGTAIPFRFAYKFEIIGNVHDNPTLMEAENEEI